MEIGVLLITLILWFVFYKNVAALIPIKNKKNIHSISVVEITPDFALQSIGSFKINSIHKT